MKTVLTAFATLLVISTLLPLIKWEVWWIRVFDFPQLQIAGLVLICMISFAYYFDSKIKFDYFLMGSLFCSFCLLLYFIFPYTIFASNQVDKADKIDEDRSISLFSANVYMENREVDRCLEKIESYDPDIVLLVETDQWWAQKMDVLKEDYPHYVEVPLDNTYGMVLYSRLPLKDHQIKYLIDKEIPSIHTKVQLPDGSIVNLQCIHPKPPAPTESASSSARDAELILIAKETDYKNQPTIVAGDLNDVAWSHTTRLFQRISGLLDPRIGRGFYNTFHAKIPIFRWPLDHVFHSSDFKLIEMQRVGPIGSDHFPIYIKLQFDPIAKNQQEEPERKEGDDEEANEKLKEVKEK